MKSHLDPEPYYRFNREERHLAAILFHLLCLRDNAKKLLCSRGLARLIQRMCPSDAKSAQGWLPYALISARTQNINVRRWGLSDRGARRGTRPAGHGPAGWKLRATLANSSASGQAAAKATRTRVAV